MLLEYHHRSKHRLDRYAPGPGRLDWANQPDPFRRYAGAAAIRLPLAANALPTRYAALRRGAPAGVSQRSCAIRAQHQNDADLRPR